MRVTVFHFNLFDENCYVLHDGEGSDALIIDPGMMSEGEREELRDFVAGQRLTVKGVLLTHCHVDHVAGVAWTAAEYGVPVMCSADDMYLAEQLKEQVRRFHLNIDAKPITVNRFLADGETLTLGDETIEVIATPGHSRGSVSFYVPQSALVVTGDTLFAGSLGRTDLEGGDLHTIIRSINDRLLTLPEETLVAPGHGPTTTIGHERRFNPAAGYKV